MTASIQSITTIQAQYAETTQKQTIIPRDLRIDGPKDLLELGKTGDVTNDQAMQVVLNRAMDKLRSVVSDAKSALGISEDTVIDTSPEATGGRIADFAIGAFSSWLKNHQGLADEDARTQFADFIGGAVQQGITEARGILSSLNALNGDVSSNIDKTWEVVQNRLNDFVAGK